MVDVCPSDNLTTTFTDQLNVSHNLSSRPVSKLKLISHVCPANNTINIQTRHCSVATDPQLYISTLRKYIHTAIIIK